jgi:aerobic-type carbon monoxide dehydrogenase small subunit (CoxS/CutS family)
MAKLNVNGRVVEVEVDPSTPLLWVLREQLELTGTKYGCGIAQCGACTVHIDGRAVRSCVYPVSAVGEQQVVTIEGLSADSSHPVQQAWVELDVPQCGYCQSGMVMAASALLAQNPQPSDADIDGDDQHLPLRHAAARAQGHPPGCGTREGGGLMNPVLSRRRFVIGAAASGAGLSLGLTLPGLGGSAQAAMGNPDEVNVWVVITPDDTVTIRIARSEMGQGTLTGLAQLVAEELDCDWSKVTTEQPTPGESLARNRPWGSYATGGSRGIRNSHQYVREGGAAARLMLVEAAAQQWGVPRTSAPRRRA